MVPPADYLSPTPIHFLTVAAKQPFEFVVAVRTDIERRLLEAAKVEKPGVLADLAIEAVRGAAGDAGLGGKTAVGYGYFDPATTGQTSQRDARDQSRH